MVTLKIQILEEDQLIYDKPSNNKWVSKQNIFNIGNNPNNLFKHFIYCI